MSFNGQGPGRGLGLGVLRRGCVAGLVACFILLLPSSVGAQDVRKESIASFIAPPFPVELVAAAGADRIAWIEYERGMRNVFTGAGPEYGRARITGNTADDGVDVSGLQISEDGALVAWLRGHDANRAGWIANPASDPRGQERAVWAAGTGGGAPWRVAEAEDFALSPDGRWIAFARDGQIFRAPVNPGLAAESDEPLFRGYGDNDDPAWSPDGARIAYVSDRGDHSFIGVFDTRNPGVRYLTPGVDRDVSPAWSPDGRRVAFIRRPGLPFGTRAQRPRELADSLLPPGLVDARFRGGARWSIRVADVETGTGREVWRNAPDDERFAEVRSIRWVGDRILFEAEPDEWRHWFAIDPDAEDASPVDLTPGEGFVEQVAFDAQGRWLYYASNIGDIERRHLWRVPVTGGRTERITDGETIATYPAVPGAGERVAFLHATDRQPLAVAVMDADGGDARILTPLPESFPAASHVEPESVSFLASDSVMVHGQLFLPPDLRRGEQRPALLFIHGGPRRQMLLGYHYMHFYHMAYAMNQYFASRGYVVLSVNYRSGIGYGRAFRMADSVGRNGSAEYRDIIAAGLYLAGRDDVDPGRVGLWGLSYGGILTAQGLARNSDVFAAGVDMAGVHFWGDSVDPESPMYQASAISHVDDWTSPVLLIHGDDDRNVAFSQTVGLVQLLRGHDVPYELIVFPDEVHDFLLHERWLIAFNATDDFFERTLIRREPVRAATGGH